ncbi:MAG: TonB-dependent receptor [Tannerellaceae bacterium]|nr:TonB-dependent receptor [Tannerellaceae bacterium]
MDHKITKKIYSMLLMLCTVFIAAAQTNTFQVTGVVEDEYGDPLIGASIIIEGDQSGTITDMDGRFEIHVSGVKTITVSYLGYSSQQFRITRSTVLNIKLKEDTQMLGDVVVFGYGTMEKKDLTGSIQSIDNTELVRSMATDVTEALNGRVSGVLVTKDSNRPGANMNIQIRGINSFNYSNEPLYVIDGVPTQSGMKHLNSNDIESIDILKDASSCAIYGSRGANGVVIITTKGANKKPGFSVDYNGYVGVKTPTRIPDMIGSKGNGLEYVDYRIALWKKKYGESSLNRSDFLTDDEKRRIKYGEYYDWLREVSGESMVTSHSISSSGSSDKISYSFGLGYLKDDGLVGKESFDRLTANIGMEYRFSDQFKMGMSSYVSFNKTNHGSNDALINAYFIPPTVSPYDKDGSYLFYCQPSSSKINPFIQMENHIRETEARYTNFAGFVEYLPIKDLSIKSQIAIQYDNDVYGEWVGTYTQAKSGVNEPEAFRKEGVNMNYVWDNILTYNKTFNNIHKLNAVGLFSIQRDTHKNSQMRGTGLPYESLWHAIQTADQLTDVESSYWESSMVSFMGRINYTLMDKYLFTVTGRYDGSSRLASGNQWGFMPSFAIGWRMSEEGFLKDVDWLTNLKPRVSWGKSGNNNIEYDITYSKLALNRYTFGSSGQNGFGLENTKGNSNLKWEMTSEWNFGLDLGFINNRINTTVDVYSRLTEDLIFKRSVASLNGYTSILENIGSTTNKGVEVGVNTVNIQTKNFTWKTSGTFSLNRNKIKELYGNGEDDLANRWFIGQPINVIYDYEHLGIWQEEERELAAKYGQVPGHIKVADRNDDDMIDERDYTILGTPSPDWTLGMTNTFTYKNWDLSVYVYTRAGGLYTDDFTYIFTAWDNEHWNKLNVNYWTPENRSNEYPEVGAQSYHTQVLSKVSGTFLKIQNITLGYTLPDSLMKKWKLKNARVYATVQNPFTFTSYKGPDPETIGEDVYSQLSLYPMTFTIGLNISF